MQRILCAAFAAPAVLISAHDAYAQGFLKRLADRAVEKVGLTRAGSPTGPAIRSVEQRQSGTPL